MAKIRVLHVERAGVGTVREIDNHKLADMQRLVGGYVESVPLPTGHTLWCNEEAILDGLPLNMVVTAGLGAGKKSLAEEMTGIPLASTYKARIHGAFYVSGADNGHGYSKGLTAKDLTVLAKHLGVTVEEGADVSA